MDKELLIVILTSSAVASVISGIFVMLNEHFRRKSEERQVITKTALKLTEITESRNREIIKAIKEKGGKTQIAYPEKKYEEYIKLIKKIWNE